MQTNAEVLASQDTMVEVKALINFDSCEINQGIIKANNQMRKKEYPAFSGNLQAEARKICIGKVNFNLSAEDND